MASLWVTSNPVFRHYAVCSGVLAMKVLSMALFTSRHRISKSVFANKEDAKLFKTVVKSDPDVERVRRAHLNDLENIPVFWILGLLFVVTDPSPVIAKICFHAFTAARVTHTIFYLNEMMPYRGISFMVGQVITIFLAGSVIYNFL